MYLKINYFNFFQDKFTLHDRCWCFIGYYLKLKAEVIIFDTRIRFLIKIMKRIRIKIMKRIRIRRPEQKRIQLNRNDINVLKKSNEGKDSTSLSKLAVVGKKIRGFKIYFVNFLLLHQLSSFVEGWSLTN